MKAMSGLDRNFRAELTQAVWVLVLRLHSELWFGKKMMCSHLKANATQKEKFSFGIGNAYCDKLW